MKDLNKTKPHLLKEIKKLHQQIKKIKESEKTAVTYLNIVDVILIVVNTEDKVTLINKKGCEILGYKKEEIIGKDWFINFLPGRIKKETKAYSMKLLSEKIKPVEYHENPVLTKKGEERLIAWHNILIRDEKGTIMGYLCSGEDITERRRTEEELKKSEENLSVTLDSIGDGVIVTDAAGKIIRMNRVAQKITGWIFEDAENLPLSKVFNIINNEIKERGIIRDVIDKKKIFKLPENTILITKNGVRLKIADSCAPILDKEKNIRGVVIVLRNITEESAMQEQLQQFRKMDSIGQLAGGIAHDFNNLLGGIIGLTDVMDMEVIENNRLKVYINKIRQTAIRASNLAKQLLAFSRRGKIQSVHVNIHNIIDDVIDLLNRTIDKRIEIIKKFNAENSIIKGDPSQIQNAILNISINARDAMPDGGKLIYYTSIVELDSEYGKRNSFDIEPGLYMQIEISDTGTGIDKQTLKRIYEPFFTTKEVGKGTGLGLAAVYGIVKEHHGAISVYSEKNQGTVFKLFFKCVDENFLNSIKIIPAGAVQGSGKILVVDDEEIIWSTADRILTVLGYDVMIATNGEEAVKLYKKYHKEIDLVVLDMIMPKMSGDETFQELRKINPNVRVLISTGYPLDTEMQSLVNKKVAGFIQKPFIMKDFSKKIAEVIGYKKR